MMSLEIVAAFSSLSRGIGSGGALPWRIGADLRRFRRLTVGAGRNAVIMGRKTWESLPERHRPLPDRLNVVLTRSVDDARFGDDVIAAASLDEALALLQAREPAVERVFVIGGESVYTEAMRRPCCHVLHVTRVRERPAAHRQYDAFFPPIDPAVFLEADVGDEQVDGDERFEFVTYVRRPTVGQHGEERQYLDLIGRILADGVERADRTGTGTRALFGAEMRFDLGGDRFPLLTTKRVFWRGVVEELLWFLRGSTDAAQLSAKGVRIWDGNGSREFLDGRGLSDRRVGDLGPVYGFQWRHFGAEYADCAADYTGKGVDQLAECLRLIRDEPHSRRIVMSAWNPADLGKMALPPCHMFVQFFVENGRLSSLMYQRSCDMGLGVPFNIASYALLTRIVAHVTDLRPGQFVHVLGDAHVYLNHVDALRQQIEREPRPFPTLRITAPRTTAPDAFRLEDFVLDGYNPHPPIKMDMAV